MDVTITRKKEKIINSSRLHLSKSGGHYEAIQKIIRLSIGCPIEHDLCILYTVSKRRITVIKPVFA